MSTHAHYKEEFGPRKQKLKKTLQKSSQTPKSAGTDGSAKLSKKNENDVNYRAARAEHFAKEARAAHEKHAAAKTPAEKAEHLATIAHAEQRAGVHSRFVTKHAPGSELADQATKHHHVAKSMHESARGEKQRNEEAEKKQEKIEAKKTEEKKDKETKSAADELKKAKELHEKAAAEHQEAKKTYEKTQETKNQSTDTKSDLTSVQIHKTQSLGGGTNEVKLVHLADGSKAVFKPTSGESGVNESPGIPWKTEYRREAASYSLAKDLGIDTVPETTTRKIKGSDGSIQRWVDGTIVKDHNGPIDRHSVEQIRLLDFVSGNDDRHSGNMIISADGKAHAIDNGRSFRTVPSGPQMPIKTVGQFAGMGLTPQIHDRIKSMDPAKIAQTLNSHKIEHEAIEHTLNRIMFLKKNPDALAIPESLKDAPKLLQADHLVRIGENAHKSLDDDDKKTISKIMSGLR